MLIQVVQNLSFVFQMNFLKNIIECWTCAFSQWSEKLPTVVHELAMRLTVFIAKSFHLFCCVPVLEMQQMLEWFVRQQVHDSNLISNSN